MTNKGHLEINYRWPGKYSFNLIDISIKRDNQYFVAELQHNGLNKLKIIRSKNSDEVKKKTDVQIIQWEEMYNKKLEKIRKNELKEEKEKQISKNIQLAEEKTRIYQQMIEDTENILKVGLSQKLIVNWNDLKKNQKFEKVSPKKPEILTIDYFSDRIGTFEEVPIPPGPDKNSNKYSYRNSLSTLFSKNKKTEKIQSLEKLYEEDYNKWINDRDSIILKNKNNLEEFKAKKSKLELELKDLNQKNLEKYSKELEKWEKEKESFKKAQNKSNDLIDELKEKYLQKDSEGMCFYCTQILIQSQYPDFIEKSFDLEYNSENGTLIVDYSLPFIDDIPQLSEVKYIKTQDTFSEKNLSKSELNRLYDYCIYNLILRSLYELYSTDQNDLLQSIVFNGWVNSIDRSTGKKKNACIASIQTTKPEFLEYNLENVDSKDCFKSLKGVCSSKLHSLTPIPPILNIDRSDKRFIDSYNVSENIDDSTNIAAMNWEEFEYLIGELFEKEFAVNGGEVKVTQASRDGGVDAIAFDPDPIRGGKIVIQAKRYTNTVGVSAVRDLFGTVHNEGAIKGILVTTADYGPDAYSFAKDKPITLLNGNNLLHLIEKHGGRAKIDLIEAKKLING
ncbi:restriction endonuclease [Methanoplanus sp. FWC-SCC4]|uniref:Restriction endonuclease n=1 Tax=Methanochimaera problematica TaxID=2609417 RepID=A0AA97FF52_9EURY|nr:restriction endonuclease [Methanoplanus sp. FWC-SCC4]WOF16296.1 restriction endonuclease [Methanoplanus sp. FWC-SCC4]